MTCHNVIDESGASIITWTPQTMNRAGIVYFNVKSVFWHTLLLLELVKQIGGTIYQPILAANKACHIEGVGSHVGGVEVQ